MGVNVQASVEAQVFGANVVGMVDRRVEDKAITTQFLVMPSELNENKSFGVDKIVYEINKTIYMIENDENDEKKVPSEITGPIGIKQVNDALNVLGLKGVELTLMQTFIYYKKEKEIKSTNDSTSNDGESAAEKPKMEYAIGIRIKTEDSYSGDFHFLKINEAYINVWDTERKNILDRMQIWTLDQLEAK